MGCSTEVGKRYEKAKCRVGIAKLEVLCLFYYMRIVFIVVSLTMVLIPIHAKAVTTIALINEDFSTVAGVITGTTWSHNGLNWVWSNVTGSVAPSGYEVYDSAGSTARNMPTSHGGFELFSVSASDPSAGTIWQVGVQVALPTNYPDIWNGNTISFDMGYRLATSNSSFELYNITDNRSIFSQTITGRVGFWDSRTFNPTFSAADAGDVVELRWRDTAAASSQLASGLEVGAVVFSVAPEPSALSFLGVGLGGLAMMRRRRS